MGFYFKLMFFFFLILSESILASPILVKEKNNVEEYKLNNGLRIILAPNSKENKVYINMVYLTGALNDPNGKSGLAHLLEHLTFKGTKNIAEDYFQQMLNQYTIANDATTGFFDTQYSSVLRVDENAINRVLYLEAERMNNLILKEELIPSEINIVNRERDVNFDYANEIVYDKLWKKIYGNKYLGRSIIGDVNDLASIDINDLKKFYDAWYVPNNAVLIITGKFNKQDILKKVDAQFSFISSRELPLKVKLPKVDLANSPISPFIVENGMTKSKIHIDINEPDENLTQTLSILPLIYDLNPSGHLYKNIVKNGKGTDVFSKALIESNYNHLILETFYQDDLFSDELNQELILYVERDNKINNDDLLRVKKMLNNNYKKTLYDSKNMLNMLFAYIVSREGKWWKYFEDQEALQRMNIDELNAQIKKITHPSKRVEITILPTSLDNKIIFNSHKKVLNFKKKNFENNIQIVNDKINYQSEINEKLKESSIQLRDLKNIVKQGELKNGMSYVLVPKKTSDDRIYLKININFGNEKSLYNKSELINFTSDLMLKASQNLNQQQVSDQFVDYNADISTTTNFNLIDINISVNKEKFQDFLNLVIQALKYPKFEQSEFDLIKRKALSEFNSPISDPETLTNLALYRILEKYQIGDLRYHFEPQLVQQRIQSLTKEQIEQFYKKFIAMNYRNITITGDFNAKNIQKILTQELSSWSSNESYKPLKISYKSVTARKVHLKTEPREFGIYKSVLAIPIGNDHPDATAIYVFSEILGGSLISSRLQQVLRERNTLVYSIGSELFLSEKNNSGIIIIDTKYTTGNSSEISNKVHEVLEDFINNGVTEKELMEVKASILHNKLAELDDQFSIHQSLSTLLTDDYDLDQERQYYANIEKLTKKDIDLVIKKHLNMNHFVEVMADHYGQKKVDGVGY